VKAPHQLGLFPAPPMRINAFQAHVARCHGVLRPGCDCGLCRGLEEFRRAQTPPERSRGAAAPAGLPPSGNTGGKSIGQGEGHDALREVLL
jgi:hypothetical protein